jgi:hypothetical protein
MTDIWRDGPFEYATTTGPRKSWADQHAPPNSDPGWELDPGRGRPGESWDRFDDHEESYWRRRVDAVEVVQITLPADKLLQLWERGRDMSDKPKAMLVRIPRECWRSIGVIASIRGVAMSEYAAGVLAACAAEVEAEVAAAGFRAVRDARRAIDAAEDLGAVYVDEPLAFRLASLAGQCRVSVPLVVDPYLRARVGADHLAAVAAEYKRLSRGAA